VKRPESTVYLTKARQLLREASIVVANDLPDAGGRAAYLAAFHAAQAFIFEVTGKAAKSHNGVRSEFARLAREEPRIDRRFPTFLARAYSFKENADYAIGHETGLTISEAKQATDIATRFVEDVERLLLAG
jgi:uncharacterized protein (UPF0332 family)